MYFQSRDPRGVSVQFKQYLFAKKNAMLEFLQGKQGKLKKDPKQNLKNVFDNILEENPG